MKVLVTGATGFVGGWLQQHLADMGDVVVTLDDDIDIRNRSALDAAVAHAGAEGVIHLAAQAAVAESWRDQGLTFEVNAVGTLNLLDAVYRATPGAPVVVVSSAEVYGILNAADLPASEELPFAPTSPYGASKAAAEVIAGQAWRGRRQPVVVARPFNHAGPGQRPEFVVSGLARQVAAAALAGGEQSLQSSRSQPLGQSSRSQPLGQSSRSQPLGQSSRSQPLGLRVGNLDVRRDITDVRDVVRAYRMLLESGQPGVAYNVSRGSSVTIEHVVRRMLAVAGVDLPIEVDPALLRPVDQPDVCGDNSRIRRVVGWKPEIDLDTTLAAVVDWWAQQISEAAPLAGA